MVTTLTDFRGAVSQVLPSLGIADSVSTVIGKLFEESAKNLYNNISWAVSKAPRIKGFILAGASLSVPFITAYLGVNAVTLTISAVVAFTGLQHDAQRAVTVNYLSQNLKDQVKLNEALKKQLDEADKIIENIEERIKTQINSNKNLEHLRKIIQEDNNTLKVVIKNAGSRVERLNQASEHLDTMLKALNALEGKSAEEISILKRQIEEDQQALSKLQEQIQDMTRQEKERQSTIAETLDEVDVVIAQLQTSIEIDE